MNNFVGYISSITQDKIIIKVPFDNIDQNFCINKDFYINSFLETNITNNFSIILKVNSINDNYDNNFNVIEWKRSKVTVCSTIIGTYNKIENSFSDKLEKYPKINNEVYLLEEKVLKTICSVDSKYLSIKVGNLINNKNIEISSNFNNLFGKHLGIFGKTGSGKSRTIAHLIRSTLNKELYKNDKKIEFSRYFNPKIIIFDYNGEYTNIVNENYIQRYDLLSNDETLWPLINFNIGSYESLDLYEYIEIFGFTETMSNHLIGRISEIDNLKKLMDVAKEKEDYKTKYDLPRINKFIKNPFFVKNLKVFESEKPELNFLYDFMNNKFKHVMIIKMNYKNPIDKLIFTLITKLIHNSSMTNNRHILIVMDESHRLFKDDNQIFHKYLELLVREGRKFNFSLWLSTQSLSDIPELYISQCSNFIVHTLNNYKDIMQVQNCCDFRLKLFEFLSTIGVQNAIVFGEAFSTFFSIKIKSTKKLSVVNSDVFDNWNKQL
ncbi:hypothetical protein STABA_v1c06140 [Spiroplasma tabanidicola]|uniref:Helicase HerA central domain-containing protein n=2 Tax=Spiroplasma tabanidicola TaxID=324079 RepID=A0A6I6C560_9MOLU|nr:hypothetical protein STABA_v1c06140 [Spiroplasma tabanidicola]